MPRLLKPQKNYVIKTEDNVYAVNKVKMIQTMYFYDPNQQNWDSEKGLTMNKTITRNNMDEMVRLLNKNAILIPLKVLKYDDIYQETKIMFSVILTEYRDFINRSAKFPLKEMIKVYESTEIERIKFECFCGEPKAKLIKAEMIMLAEQLEDLLDTPPEHRSWGEKWTVNS